MNLPKGDGDKFPLIRVKNLSLSEISRDPERNTKARVSRQDTDEAELHYCTSFAGKEGI